MPRSFSEWLEGPRRLVVAGVALLLLGLTVYLLWPGGDTDTVPPELRPVRAAFAKQDVPKLVEFTKGGNPAAIADAIWCLQQLKYPELAPLLRERAAAGQPAAVRTGALTNLGLLKDPASLPILVAATTDGDPEVRRAACEGLAYIESADVIEPLAAVLEKPVEDPRVLYAAWASLKQVTGASGALKTSLSPADRQAAATNFRARIPMVQAANEFKAKNPNGPAPKSK